MENFSFEEVSPPFLPSLGFSGHIEGPQTSHLFHESDSQLCFLPCSHPSSPFPFFSLPQGSDLSYGDSDFPSPMAS